MVTSNRGKAFAPLHNSAGSYKIADIFPSRKAAKGIVSRLRRLIMKDNTTYNQQHTANKAQRIHIHHSSFF